MLETPVHSTNLVHIISHHFGIDAWGWHPQTMLEELIRTFGDVDVSNVSRAHALQVLHISDAPKKDWIAFEKVLQGLLGNAVLFHVMQRPNLIQLFVGIDIILTLDPDFEREVSQDIVDYIAAVFAEEEVPWVPQPFADFEGVQDSVTRLTRIDPEAFAQDYQELRREPASKLLLRAFDGVLADQEARKKGLS